MRIWTTRFDVDTPEGVSFEDITARLEQALAASGTAAGFCVLSVQADECALALVDDLDETAEDLIRLGRDHLVRRDAGGSGLRDRLDELADAGYIAAVPAHTLTVPLRDGHLAAGSWERILLLDTGGPSTRQIDATVMLL